MKLALLSLLLAAAAAVVAEASLSVEVNLPDSTNQELSGARRGSPGGSSSQAVQASACDAVKADGCKL